MDAPDSDESNLLERCPRCTYSLRGLPAQHRCPECGLEVDRRWQVFGGRSMSAASRRSGLAFGYFIAGVVAFYALGALIAMFYSGELRDTGLYFLLIGVVIGGLLWSAFRPPRHFVAVGPAGVVVYRGKNITEHYAWDAVGRARLNLMKKAVVFDVGDGEIALKNWFFFGWSMAEADRAVRGINHFPRPSPKQSGDA